MKNFGFIIFFSLVLIIYSAINFYILRRGLSSVPYGSSLRTWLVVIVILLASSFVAGRFIERVSVNVFSTALIWIGSFWLAFMVYLLLQIILIDLLRVLNLWFGIFPAFITNNPIKAREITAIVVLSITSLVVVIGHINTWFPVVRNFELKVDKTAGKLKELNIVALSDIHLGTTIEKRHLSVLVKKVNLLNPDIILIPGDIIDEDIAPVIHNNVGGILKEFKSKYGVYAVTGNHEYIGGVSKAKKYLNEHNVKLLNDSVVMIDSSFYLVGREDLTMKQFTNKTRKELPEIMVDVDKSFPVILLDHQPFKLNVAVENGVDLQLSGHTHHGQLWPFNYITDMIFEVSWGYKLKEDTHIYVSSGAGGWGPPIRTVNRPEIISIKLIFEKTEL